MARLPDVTLESLIAEGFNDPLIPKNSRIAFEKDLARFFEWGGTIPSTPTKIKTYLLAHQDTHKLATLSRWVSSLSRAHQIIGYKNPPTRNPVVRQTLNNIKKANNGIQRKVTPIETKQLMVIVDSMGERLTDLRNKALLLIAFSGALKRSEVTKLNVEDIRFDIYGIVINLKKEECAMNSTGSPVAISVAQNKKRYCPVSALLKWLEAGKISDGPVFRAINKIGTVAKNGMTTQSVANIVKEAVKKAGLDPGSYSGHSMRAGFAVSAASDGKAYHKIKTVTRHQSDMTLVEYLRDGGSFESDARNLFNTAK